MIDIDGMLFRREPDDIDRAFAAERRKAFLASPPTRKPRKARKPTLALAQADKAGKPVRGAVIAPSGEFTLQFGEPESAPPTNPWLDDLKVTKQ